MRKKTIKIEKAVRKQYVVTEKKERRVRDYYIISPTYNRRWKSSGGMRIQSKV